MTAGISSTGWSRRWRSGRRRPIDEKSAFGSERGSGRHNQYWILWFVSDGCARHRSEANHLGGSKKRGGRSRPEAYLSGLQIAGRSLPALFLEVEADLLAFAQIAHPRALDRRDMDENVLRAVIRLNETEARLGV